MFADHRAGTQRRILSYRRPDIRQHHAHSRCLLSPQWECFHAALALQIFVCAFVTVRPPALENRQRRWLSRRAELKKRRRRREEKKQKAHTYTEAETVSICAATPRETLQLPPACDRHVDRRGSASLLQEHGLWQPRQAQAEILWHVLPGGRLVGQQDAGLWCTLGVQR